MSCLVSCRLLIFVLGEISYIFNTEVKSDIYTDTLTQNTYIQSKRIRTKKTNQPTQKDPNLQPAILLGLGSTESTSTHSLILSYLSSIHSFIHLNQFKMASPVPQIHNPRPTTTLLTTATAPSSSSFGQDISRAILASSQPPKYASGYAYPQTVESPPAPPPSPVGFRSAGFRWEAADLKRS